MTLSLRSAAIVALAAASLAVPAPAMAWGKKEQRLVTALAAAGVIGGLYLYQQKQARAGEVGRAGSYTPQTVYRQPVNTRPVYREPVYQPQEYREPITPQPIYSRPIAPAGSGHTAPSRSGTIYSIPAAQAFNSYPLAERRAIQSRLATWGYYGGSIDGSWGPMTHRAIMAFAVDADGTDRLTTVGGATGFYNSLIR